MIVSYAITNFKSIKLREEISFEPKQLKSKVNSIKNDLLSVISIYGPNGGGKSSIIESIMLFKFLFDMNNNNMVLDTFFNDMNIYRFHSKKECNTIWEFIFKHNDNLFYRYEVRISKNNIEYECLEKKQKLEKRNKWKKIFLRKVNDYELSVNLKKLNINKNNVNGLFLSYISSFIVDIDLLNVRHEIEKIFCINSFNLSPTINSFPSLYKVCNFNTSVIENNKEIFLKIFKEIDINIIDLRIQKTPDGSSILMVKKIGEDLEEFEISYECESYGTKKIIQLLTFFIIGFKNGYTFVVDELDSSLHTKLLGYIIESFYSKNNNKSQLLYTSHDMATLDSKYFRKDQIYFSAINESYFTNLVRLSDFYREIKNETPFAKRYLDGKLGYDPYIQKCGNWGLNEKSK